VDGKLGLEFNDARPFLLGIVPGIQPPGAAGESGPAELSDRVGRAGAEFVGESDAPEVAAVGGNVDVV